VELQAVTPWLEDADVRLYHGDVLSVLRELPAESVDCCVTSPPYWGLRDYGTGAWEGGSSECDHLRSNRYSASTTLNAKVTDGASEAKRTPYRDTCGKCGATRIDQQLGLEPTPEEYVTRMVEVFREVRRVLASHGTVWLNLGDSYTGGGSGDTRTGFNARYFGNPEWNDGKQGGHGQARAAVRLDKPERALRVRETEGTHGELSHGLRRKPKDLVGIPWRVAFALQADGWYLRSDIIWAKPNPMPESVTDRPTKAHEYVFLLSKQLRYFFDAEAVREKDGGATATPYRKHADEKARSGAMRDDYQAGLRNGFYPGSGRNIRSVWEIATQPYPEAHFATFPEELARRCIAAGCPEQVCRVCGKARARVVERKPGQSFDTPKTAAAADARGGRGATATVGQSGGSRIEGTVTTLGFTNCMCEFLSPRSADDAGVVRLQSAGVAAVAAGVGDGKYRPGVVLDPFIGSGTVAHVARKLGRHAVGIDLNESYLELAARRLQQQSLFAGTA
jgi:site-specific DNA-methyltransferase (cytosine-N4-specific)